MTDTTERPAAPPRAVSPWRSIGPVAQARRRPLLVTVGVLFVLVSIPFGFPTGRDVITAWVLLLLLAACGGEWQVWRRAVLKDWLPLIAVLFLYDFLRGSADELGSRLVSLPALTNGEPPVWTSTVPLPLWTTLTDIRPARLLRATRSTHSPNRPM